MNKLVTKYILYKKDTISLIALGFRLREASCLQKVMADF